MTAAAAGAQRARGVFAKLAISSRVQLDQVLASDPAATKPE